MKFRALFASVLLAFFLAFVSAFGQVPHFAEKDGPFLALSWGNYSASGVCVKCDGTRSLVLSNNHLFAIQPFVGAAFPLGNYPLKTKVSSIDGKKVWEGVAVGGDKDHDLAIVVVDGVIAFSPLADKNAPPGTDVWHRGMGAKGAHAFGKVLDLSTPSVFVSTLRSVPGDSGSGIFGPAGDVVAVNCGRIGWPIDAPERGVQVEVIRAVLKRLEASIPEGLRP